MKASLFSLTKTATLIFTLVLIPLSVTFAQSPAVQEARQAAKEQIEKVIEQDEQAASVVKREPLNEQIKTVSSILSVMESEIVDVAGKLERATQAKDADLAQASSVLLLRVRLYEAHLGLLRNQITGEDVSEARLQSIVDALKVWQSEIYEPIMRQALDASLLEQGHDALATVTTRLERVYADVVALTKNSSSEGKQLLNHFDAASKQVQRAAKAYEQARALFNEQQEEFLSIEPSVDTGFSKEVTLTAGPEGDFLCLPYSMSSNRGCTPVFRLQTGEYYLLLTADGQPFQDLSSGVYRVTGPLTVLKNIVSPRGAQGVLIVIQANKKIVSLSEERPAVEGEEGVATVLDTLLQKKNAGTVRGFIETEIRAIASAYKTFFTMTKIAKSLVKK